MSTNDRRRRLQFARIPCLLLYTPYHCLHQCFDFLSSFSHKAIFFQPKATSCLSCRVVLYCSFLFFIFEMMALMRTRNGALCQTLDSLLVPPENKLSRDHDSKCNYRVQGSAAYTSLLCALRYLRTRNLLRCTSNRRAYREEALESCR